MEDDPKKIDDVLRKTKTNITHCNRSDIKKFIAFLLEAKKPSTGSQHITSPFGPATTIEELDKIAQCQLIVSIQLERKSN